jgi:hypothetical protein
MVNPCQSHGQSTDLGTGDWSLALPTFLALWEKPQKIIPPTLKVFHDQERYRSFDSIYFHKDDVGKVIFSARGLRPGTSWKIEKNISQI